MSSSLKKLLGEELASYFQYRDKKKCCEWDGETLIADYLVLGGGTSGNVVARRLTDDLKIIGHCI